MTENSQEERGGAENEGRGSAKRRDRKPSHGFEGMNFEQQRQSFEEIKRQMTNERQESSNRSEQ